MCTAIPFAVSVYGGYFGAAQGVLLMGFLGLFLAESLQRQNALKNVLAGFVTGDVLQVRDVARGHDHQVTAGVRVRVQQREGMPAAPHDVGGIVRLVAGQDRAKYAVLPPSVRARFRLLRLALVARGSGAADVRHAPARPQSLQGHEASSIVGSGPSLASISPPNRATKSSTGTPRSGDVLLQYGDTPLNSQADLQKAAARAAKMAQVKVWRLQPGAAKAKELTLQVSAGKLGVLVGKRVRIELEVQALPQAAAKAA